MKKYLLKIVLCLILLSSTAMATEEWVLGQPVQTDTTNYEWVSGSPYIVIEEVVVAPSGQVITIIMTSIPLFLIPFFFIKRRTLRR